MNSNISQPENIIW